MSTLVKLGLSGYDVKPRFVRFNANISYKIQKFGGTIYIDTYEKKINPPSIILGGGGHGKVCWLIAYYIDIYFGKNWAGHFKK